MKHLLLAALVLVAACGAPIESPASPTPSTDPSAPVSPTPTLDPRPARSAELEAAATRWTDAAYAAYSFTLERRCFCLPASQGPWTVTVIVGEASVVDATGEAPDPSFVDGVPLTIDALFAFLRMQLDADDFTVSYDPVTGAPLEVAIDPSFMMADEETGFLVRDLAPLSIDQ
jgi:hypothetical protein